MCSATKKKKKEGKWLRGHRGHLNCFILKQTRHVIKIPQDALIKLTKLIQIISLISQTIAQRKTSIRLFKPQRMEGGLHGRQEQNGHPHDTEQDCNLLLAEQYTLFQTLPKEHTDWLGENHTCWMTTWPHNVNLCYLIFISPVWLQVVNWNHRG